MVSSILCKFTKQQDMYSIRPCYTLHEEQLRIFIHIYIYQYKLSFAQSRLKINIIDKHKHQENNSGTPQQLIPIIVSSRLIKQVTSFKKYRNKIIKINTHIHPSAKNTHTKQNYKVKQKTRPKTKPNKSKQKIQLYRSNNSMVHGQLQGPNREHNRLHVLYFY